MQIDINQGETAPNIPLGPPKEMISVVTLEGGKTLVRVNSSSLAVIQECLRKAQYSLDEKWRSQSESPATLFGTAIHKALEVFYQGDPKDRILPALEDMEILVAGARVMKDGPLLLHATQAFIDKAAPLAALPDSDKRSIMNGVWTLHHYFKAYIDDPFVAHVDAAGQPYVERTFTFTLFEDSYIRIDYFGTVDLVMKHAQTGELHVCDHKTSSVVGADFYNRIKPNHQYTGYIMGARECFGIDTNSFIVNCVQVKARPVTARGQPPHFPRQVTTRDEGDFEEFRESVVAAVYSYLEARRIGTWPIGHVNVCASYAGCQFLSVCSAPKSLRENIMTAKFNRGVL